MKVDDILDILKYKQSHIEVFTAHPTYNGSPEYTDKILRFFAALEADPQNFDIKLVSEILKTPSVRKEDMSVREESEFIIKHLKVAEKANLKLHQDFDLALKEIFQDEYSAEKQTALNLGIRFKAWGIGGADKDGNKNAVESDLDEGLELLKNLNETSPGLASTELEFRDTAENNIPILKNIIPENVIFAHIPREFVFHERVKNYEDLADLKNINLDNFRKEIGSVLARVHNDNEKAHSIFNDYEDVTRFMELPEKEFTSRQKDFSLKDQKIYSELQKQLTGQVREKLISGLLNLEKYPAHDIQNWCQTSFAALEKKMEADPQLKAEVTGKGYKNADYSYFYHAVKREGYIKNSTLCTSHVCAEASQTIEYKEQLLFQRAVDNESKRIILLFEEPEVLKKKNLTRTINSMIHDPVIFTHIVDSSILQAKIRWNLELPNKILKILRALKPNFETQKYHLKLQKLNDDIQKLTDGKLGLKDIFCMQIMLAHSDNTRRGGMLGARALIYDAHTIFRNILKTTGITPRFYEGSSLTDSLRGGFLPLTNHANLYETHDYLKSTIQGIDIAVTYNSAQTGADHLAKILCNSLDVLSVKFEFVKNKAAKSTSQPRKIGRLLERDLKLVKTLGNSIDYYIEEYFLNNSLGYTIAQIYEKQNDSHANKASRKGRKLEADSPYFQHPQADRTIIYSERGQQMGDNFGYVGGAALGPVIAEAIYTIKNIDKFTKKYFRNSEKAERNTLAIKNYFEKMSDTEILREIFTICPEMAEIKERMAFSLASTDLEIVWKKALELGGIKNKNGDVVETISNRPTHQQLEKLAATKDKKPISVAGILAFKELEFRTLAGIIFTSFTAQELNISEMTTKELREKIIGLLSPESRKIISVNDSANILMQELKYAANQGLACDETYTLKDVMHFFKDICLFQH